MNIHTLTNYHLSSSGHTCIFSAAWLLLNDAVTKDHIQLHLFTNSMFYFDWHVRFDGDNLIAAEWLHRHTFIIIYPTYHMLLFITASWQIIDWNQNANDNVDWSNFDRTVWNELVRIFISNLLAEWLNLVFWKVTYRQVSNIRRTSLVGN